MTTRGTFVCAECDVTFLVLRDDAEAWAEAQAAYGPLLVSGECTVVCAACYDGIMAALPRGTVH